MPLMWNIFTNSFVSPKTTQESSYSLARTARTEYDICHLETRLFGEVAEPLGREHSGLWT